ncbi:MAG: hypothetical protein ACJA0N_000843 [Pseudohongiellaceae bacterium]|jgi:hypothetical protein
MTQPDNEWKKIEKEQVKPTTIMLAYTGILAAIAPICAYYSTTQIGWSASHSALIKLANNSALELCVLTYIAMLVGVFALG